MTAINPNHPVSRAFGDEWHKLCALILSKLGLDRIYITAEDIAALEARHGGAVILCHSRKDSIELRIVTEEEAERIGREVGGLPT